jgi:hypothetical protein
LQTATIHREHLVHSNRVKFMYLVDGFLRSVDDENPMTLYSIARSMFELNAFLHEINHRLIETVAAVSDRSWRPLGEKFFGLLVRARYATTNPEFRSLLLEAGVPSKRVEPFNITNCVRGLASEPEYTDADTRYSLLCDFVHHNLSSATTANSGIRLGDSAYAGSGRMMADREGAITRYEYPVVGKFTVQIDRVAPGFLRDAQGCVGWLNTMPQSPFPIEMNEHMTGSPHAIPTEPGEPR